MGTHAEPGARRDRVAILVNSLGAIPLVEPYISYARLAERLAAARLIVQAARLVVQKVLAAP